MSPVELCETFMWGNRLIYLSPLERQTETTTTTRYEEALFVFARTNTTDSLYLS